jgi:hypothetical protein
VKEDTIRKLERIFEVAHVATCFIAIIPLAVISLSPIWLWFCFFMEPATVKWIWIIILIVTAISLFLWWLTILIWDKLHDKVIKLNLQEWKQTV